VKAAAASCALLSGKTAGGQIRLRQFSGIQFALLFFVQPLEFRFHKFPIYARFGWGRLRKDCMERIEKT
jgi:predicted MPP superfamily phosphohydrolase